jgi:hypothetical protein
MPVLMLVSNSVYSALKMEVLCPSETSVDFQRTARRFISEDIALQNHLCENLKPNNTRSPLAALPLLPPMFRRR